MAADVSILGYLAARAEDLSGAGARVAVFIAFVRVTT